LREILDSYELKWWGAENGQKASEKTEKRVMRLIWGERWNRFGKGAWSQMEG